MTNKQHKERFIRSKVNECLHNAAIRLQAGQPSLYQINLALAFARQLSDTPKNRAIRAHVVTAREAIAYV